MEFFLISRGFSYNIIQLRTLPFGVFLANTEFYFYR